MRADPSELGGKGGPQDLGRQPKPYSKHWKGRAPPPRFLDLPTVLRGQRTRKTGCQAGYRTIQGETRMY